MILAGLEQQSDEANTTATEAVLKGNKQRNIGCRLFYNTNMR